METLAALQEILLKARIRFTHKTENEWAAENPLLLDGEIGFVKDTTPLKFKIGNGTKSWTSLEWGQPVSISQLALDPLHQTVNIDQILKWDNKAEKTPATTAADGLMSAADKQKLDGVAAGANNYVHPSAHPASMITPDATHRFVTDAEKTKWNTEYTLEKVTTEPGFASTYHLKKGNEKVGASINIPLDQVLRSSSIKSVTTANTPYSGAKVGDKYIEFLFQNNPTPQYLPVQDLVDVYTGDGTYIQVSSSNVITLQYAALKTRLQSDLAGAFDAKGAGAAAAQSALDAFKSSTLILECSIPGM